MFAVRWKSRVVTRGRGEGGAIGRVLLVELIAMRNFMVKIIYWYQIYKS